MARAALAYLHAKAQLPAPEDDLPEQPEMSRTEIARHIAFLLDGDDGNEN